MLNFLIFYLLISIDIFILDWINKSDIPKEKKNTLRFLWPNLGLLWRTSSSPSCWCFVIRNKEGQVLLAASFHGSTTWVAIVELMATWFGLKSATATVEHDRFFFFWVETPVTPSTIRDFETSSPCSLMLYFSCQHVLCKANEVPDNLANFASIKHLEFVWTEIFPRIFTSKGMLIELSPGKSILVGFRLDHNLQADKKKKHC